jgi:hypothetical protein
MRPPQKPALFHRSSGQSIPLVAFMIVVLVAIIGLSVDAGNTYAEQRELVAATNAASIVGMQSHLTSNATQGEVRLAIEESLKGNGIVLDDDDPQQRTIVVTVLNSTGEFLTELGPNPDGKAENNPSPMPNNTAYIEVKANGNVDTFFARLVGTDDLPVDHQSYAGICPPNSGVYPIAVPNSMFTDSGLDFNNPDGTLPATRGDSWAGRPYKRMYRSDDTPSGGFSWLRWGETSGGGNSQVALAESLTGYGNIADSFQEAPQPGLNLVPPDDPETYPHQPGQINALDWVWQNTGNTVSNAVVNAIDYHKVNKTVMILPIWDYHAEGGANGRFRVVRLASFGILDYGLRGQGNDTYFDLVYLGDDATYTACSVTAVQPALLGLTGDVSFWPEYKTESEDRLPVQYFVVLDASGSMNFSFDGWGWDPDKDDRKACAVELDGTVIDGKTYSASGCSGSGDGWSGGNAYHAWHPIKERRAYVAKKALERLIDLGNFEGSAAEDTSMPYDQMQIIWFGHVQKPNWESDRSSDAEYLREALLMAGVHPGGNRLDRYDDLDWFDRQNKAPDEALEPNAEGLTEIYYTSNGGTNGAAGLYRASIRMGEAPERVTFNGETKDYKRAIILVTDGVSNQFLDMTDNDELQLANNRTKDRFANPSFCRDELDEDIERHNSARCQTTSGAAGPNETGENAGKWLKDGVYYDRPITQMGNVSEQFLRPNAEVYVIALSNFATTGLKERVASFSDYFVSVPSLEWKDTDNDGVDDTTNVDQIVDYIQAKVGQGDCIANAENRWVGTMTSDEADGRFYTWPKVGYVELMKDNQLIETTDIVLDEATGTLRYTFNNNLAAGNYELRAALTYIHPVDETSRTYSEIMSFGEEVNPTIGVALEANSEVGGSMIEFDLQLKMPGEDSVCPKLLPPDE